jgi:demethylspheroidene O-methyltransferase
MSLSLIDRWCSLRDRLLTSAAFARWATAFPLTRPLARQRARQLFDVVAGFVYSQVLAACVRLDLFNLVHPDPATADALAAKTGLPAESMRTLLRAAASLQLIEPRGADRWGLGKLGAAVLANPGIAAMVEHHVLLYRDLEDPVALLHHGQTGADGQLARYWPYAAEEPSGPLAPDAVTPYTALMSASQPMVAEEVLAAVSLGRHRCLLDVGGGDGSFLRAVGQSVPRLQLMLIDLPPVAAVARRKLADAGLADRAEVHEGDFFATPLPAGADVVTLVRVLHDHDDARVLRLLRAVRAALPADGTLVVAEPLAGTPGAAPMGDAYFGLYLFAMGRGRPRTFEELAALLTAAGFVRVQRKKTRIPLLTSIVVARCDAADSHVNLP